MGLDAVELVMDVEEAFDIRIDDACATQIRTVGDLFELVVQAMPQRDAGNTPCLSAATFRLIRRTLHTQFQLDVARLRPRDRVATVVPDQGRRRFWSQLQQSLSVTLPPLVRSSWLVVVLTLIALACALLTGFYASCNIHAAFSVPAALATIACVGIALARLSRPLARHPSASSHTFGDLTRTVLAHNHAPLATRLGSWNSTDIWNSLKMLVVEQSGVDPDKVTRDARFVEDLGLG